MAALSARLREIVDALPLIEGMRVIDRLRAGRSRSRSIAPRGATAQVVRNSADLISAGRLSVKTYTAEDLLLDVGEQAFDLVFAVRVGAFDGRHPDRFDQAVRAVGAALVPWGRLVIDGGKPLQELELPPQA